LLPAAREIAVRRSACRLQSTQAFHELSRRTPVARVVRRGHRFIPANTNWPLRAADAPRLRNFNVLATHLLGRGD